MMTDSQHRTMIFGLVLAACSGLVLLVTWLSKVQAETPITTTSSRQQIISNPNPPMRGYNQPRTFTVNVSEQKTALDPSKSGNIARFYSLLPYTVGLIALGGLLMYMPWSASRRAAQAANTQAS